MMLTDQADEGPSRFDNVVSIIFPRCTDSHYTFYEVHLPSRTISLCDSLRGDGPLSTTEQDQVRCASRHALMAADVANARMACE
jgi:hypothetical protein